LDVLLSIEVFALLECYALQVVRWLRTFREIGLRWMLDPWRCNRYIGPKRR